MLQSLWIAHAKKPQTIQTDSALVWATCLRTIAVVDSSFTPATGVELYHGRAAYQFLLSIICGLHSPLIGETEVFGQFKTFCAAWLAVDPKQATLIQRLTSDAKAIRTEHLNQIGVQSYGSWVRKNLIQGEVHLIGGGQLAREVLPYVEKQALKVTVHVRDPRKTDFFKGEVRQLKNGGFDGGIVIIAAPISSADVRAWLGGKNADQLFDLRETSMTDAVGPDHAQKTYLLSQIFQQIEDVKIRLQPVVEKVKSEISMRAEKLAQQGLVRPQGWDDLCA